jgi:hypothetical protein
MASSSIPGQQGGAGSVAATKGWNPANPSSATGMQPSQLFGGNAAAQPAAAAAAQPAAQQNPYDMNQAYLTALSNPGHVTTPGATVPQAAPPSAQSGVLQQFMQNWKPGANPAGNYDPSLFVNALRGQV